MHSMHLDTSRLLGSTADDNHARKTTPTDKKDTILEMALCSVGAILLIVGVIFINHQAEDPVHAGDEQRKSTLITGCVMVVIGGICIIVWSIEICCSHPISRWMGFLPNQ